MNIFWRRNQRQLLHWIAVAVTAFLLCLLFAHSTYAEPEASTSCSHSVEYEERYIYCASTSAEAAESIESISALAANREIPISAIRLDSDESQQEETAKNRRISYLREGPLFNNETTQARPLITVSGRTLSEGREILSNVKAAIQNYRRQQFGCELTNQIVSIGREVNSEPFLCVQSGLLGDDFTARAEKIQRKIDQVAQGNINIETLEIVPLSDVRTSMGISRYAEFEGDPEDINKQAMAIVSKTPALVRQEKIILIVTVLDAALHSKETNKEIDIAISPYQLASDYLSNLVRISRYAYQTNARPVTFNMTPFFWVTPPPPIQYPSNKAVCTAARDDSRRKAISLFPIFPAKEGYYNASFRADEISRKIEEFANSFNPLPFSPGTVPLDSLTFTGDGGLNSQIYYKKSDSQRTSGQRIIGQKASVQGAQPRDVQSGDVQSGDIQTGDAQLEEDSVLIMTLTEEDIECFRGSANQSDSIQQVEAQQVDTQRTGEPQTNAQQLSGVPAEEIKKTIERAVKEYRTAYYYSTALIVFLLATWLLLTWLSRTPSVWRYMRLRPLRPLRSLRRRPAILVFLGRVVFVALVIAVVSTPFVWRSEIIRAGYEPYQALREYVSSDLLSLASIVGSGLLIIWFALPTIDFVISKLDIIESSKRKASIALLRFVIFAVTCVLASPYLPGAGTVYLAGISGFVALAFSLSAGAAVGDITAGLVLIFFSRINEGSWIQIGSIQGEVINQNLFVHSIKTSKNEILTLPNSKVLSDTITDYSKSLSNEHDALVIHTTVTLGYNIPWQQVHQLLIEAAIAVNQDPIWEELDKKKNKGKKAEDRDDFLPIREDKSPFVLQLSLDDFYVTYQLNAYTNHRGGLSLIYSKLHESIQSKLHSANIEIVSPHYAADRDPSNPVLPPRVVGGSEANGLG